MLTLPIGILSVLVVIFFSLDRSDLAIYANQHSFIVVVLGTLAVVLSATPKKDLLLTIKAIKNLFKKDGDKKHLKEVLVSLSKNRNQKEGFEDVPLVSFALELWEQGVDEITFRSTIYEKYDELNKLSEIPVSVVKNLAKYPPALGMTGTVMGMISLFANLNADNKSSVGQALALAMTATFYGLMLANFVILPLADRLHARHMLSASRNDLILNALLKINSNEPSSMIENMNIEQEYYEQAG